MAGARPAKGKILILSLTGDVHVPAVTKHLQSETVFVDPYRMLEKCELSFANDGHATTVIYDGKPIQDIKSVWYRRPYIPEREDLNVPAGYKDYSYTAIRKHTLDLFGLFRDAFWLSSYYTIMQAETKPWQLQLAASLGFRVPRTLTTMSEPAARAFMEETGDIVIKSMATTLPVVNNKVQYFYTTKIPAGTRMDLKGLHLAPTIFQEAVPTATDLRITVVGDKVFAAAVRDKGQDDHPAIRDWRRGYKGAETVFEPHELPAKLQKMCVRLTKEMGLSFGAIDLLIDTSGDYWFLEINPNGQWLFIEDDTGMPIGKAIADLLEQGKTDL